MFYSTPASALAWHYDWSLLSRYVSGDQVSSTLFGVRSNIFAEHEISSTVLTRGQVVLNLNQGSYRSLYNDEFAPRQEVSLQQALIQWSPISRLNVQIGILNSQQLDTPFLISPSQPMIGAGQAFHQTLSDRASIHLRLQQSIPGEQEKFYRVGQIDKGIPSLLLETLELRYQKLSLTIGYFAFSQLAHTTAYESQFMGNSIVSGTKETASFLYPYRGYLLNAAYHTPVFRNFDLHLKSHYLHNTQAPQNRNDGFLGELGISSQKLGLVGKYFINRSDSSPGVYNDKSYGHNNRKGYGLEVFWKNPKKHYHLKLDFIHSKVLERDIPPAHFQSNTNLAKISITFTPSSLTAQKR